MEDKATKPAVRIAPECVTCQWLLHYEWDKDVEPHKIHRCCLDFRNGNKVIHPCTDYLIRKEYRDEEITKPNKTRLHEFGSPKGLPRGWRGRILKGNQGGRQ